MNNPKSSEQMVLRFEIAQRLRLAREYAGLSQGQIAKLLGMSRPSITEIEAGRRRVAAEEIPEFARHYGVSLDWLSGTEESPASTPEIELIARKLSSINSDDLSRVIEVLKVIVQPPGRDQ